MISFTEDTLPSGSSRGFSVKVQVLLPAPKHKGYAKAYPLCFGLVRSSQRLSAARLHFIFYFAMMRRGNVWRVAKQMTDGVRQDKLAVSLRETGSTCPFTRTSRQCRQPIVAVSTAEFVCSAYEGTI